MSLFSAISSFVSGALGTIGGVIASALGALGPGGIAIVGGFLTSLISSVLGDKADPEELGRKIMWGYENGMGKQSNESFLEARKRYENFEVDSKYDSNEAKCVGLAYQIQCGIERGKDISEFASAISNLYKENKFDEKLLDALRGMVTAHTELDDIGKYINGNLSSSETLDRCMDKIAQAAKAANPSLSDNEAYVEALKYRG